MKEQIALQSILRTRLETLRLRYPRYSVRAFAKKAGLSPATLSLLLQGKRKVSRKLVSRISERLRFDPQERAEVLPARPEETPPPTVPYVQLTEDQYRVIADWRAFAILSLIRTEGFRDKPAWIAARLGINVADAADTLACLERLGMVVRQNGRLRRAAPKYRTTEDVANLSLQRSHQQTLELAARSLENDPVGLRDFTWVTLPLDLRKLADAKALIRKFQDEFIALVGDQARPTEVFRLAIQLFPLTKQSNPTEEKHEK